ncbi:MAG: PIN domain-containing protein [Calditrichia bacterium]
MKIFLDEAAWLALADNNHPLHQPVRENFKHFLDEGDSIYTTNVVVGQVLSHIKMNQGFSDANRFYDVVEEAWLGAHLHMLWIGRRTQKDAMKLFRKFPDSNLSLFDCANVVLMNRRNIRFIITENSAYSKMGFKIVPERVG